MVQFLSINYFSWISAILVGVFKSSRFLVSSCIKSCLQASTRTFSHFSKNCKQATIRFIMSIRLSLRTEKLGSTGGIFRTFYIWAFLENLTRITGGYFTRRPAYIYDSIWLNSSQSEKCFRQKLHRKSKHTFLYSTISSSQRSCLYEIMWKNNIEPHWSQMTI